MGNIEKIFDSNDARSLSHRRLPKLIYDFIEGATGREISSKGNVTAFDDVKLLPRALVDVSERNLTTSWGTITVNHLALPLWECVI